MRSFVISGLVVLAAVACGSKNSSTDGNGSGSPTQGPQGAATSSASGATAAEASPSTVSASSASTSGSGDAGPGTSLPALHVRGNAIVDANGNTVVFRGVAIPDIGVLFTEGGGISGVTDRIDEILGSAALGIRAIRLPVYPRTVVNGGDPTYSPLPYPVGPAAPGEAGAATQLSASQYIAEVLQPAVDYATSKSLYAIVDYHQIDNVTMGTSSADAVTFWTTVAPVFANYPNVLYEAFNEPIDATANAGITASGAWTSAFTAAAQSWIAAIRAGAPSNVIIVGSPSWSQYPDGALTAGLMGGNLAFTAHAYPNNWPGTMNAFQNRVAKAAMGEPVAMTEWGYQIGTETPNDTWAQNLQAFVNDGGENWTAWVADPSWGPPMFTKTPTSSFNSFDGLTDFGTFVQTWLASYTGGTTGGNDGGTDQ